jgi:predicted nuclease of restriction endonuclease-like (RecB) superfamily
VGQLPWGPVRVLLDKLDEPAARDRYARAAVAGGWTRNVLLNQIKGQARDRVGADPSNFERALPGEDSEFASQIAKDPYVFDFLRLSGRVAERELEQALMGRLRDTLLELGTGFSFVGQQYHLDVGGDDYFIDLLFFNIPQVRYVVVDLKIGKFEPEFTAELGFYIAAVNDRLRDPAKHAPTVGILMCANRNDTVVRYALSGLAQPMAVAGTPTTRCHRPNGPHCPATPGWPRLWKPPSTRGRPADDARRIPGERGRWSVDRPRRRTQLTAHPWPGPPTALTPSSRKLTYGQNVPATGGPASPAGVRPPGGWLFAGVATVLSMTFTRCNSVGQERSSEV